MNDALATAPGPADVAAGATPEMAESQLLSPTWPQPPDPSDIYINLELDIEPVPKGRPRTAAAEYSTANGVRTKTRDARTYTPKATSDYQASVGWLLRKAGIRRNDTDDLGVYIVFHVRGQQRRDIDNLIKSLLDGCNGVAWRDDQQVTRVVAEVVRDSDRPRVRLVAYVARRRARSCRNCGRALTPRQITSDQIYCSMSCYGTTQREGTNRVCVTCGTVVWRNNEKAGAQDTFCSPACRTARRLKCRQCGEPTKNPPSTRRSFCSPVCSEAWHRAKKPGAKSYRRGTCVKCGAPTAKPDSESPRCRACYIRDIAQRGTVPNRGHRQLLEHHDPGLPLLPGELADGR